MVRYKGGRPSTTSQIENELMYYFNKIVDDNKHYSLNDCAYIFNISRQAAYNKVCDIDKKCKRNKDYLQYIKDTYSKFNTIAEALDGLNIDVQPILNTKTCEKTMSDTLNLDINIRDIAFNLIEINKFIRSMKQIPNNNPNVSTNVSKDTDISQLKESMKIIIKALKALTQKVVEIHNYEISVDSKLSNLENNVFLILNILQDSETSSPEVDLQPTSNEAKADNSVNFNTMSNAIRFP